MNGNDYAQWWNQWLDSWQALAEPRRPSNPWAASLDQWSRMFSPPPPQSADVFQRMLAQGKSFFAFGDALTQSCEGPDPQQWFSRSLENLKQVFGSEMWQNSAAAAAPGLWQLPLEAWQRTAAMIGGLPADYLHAAPGGLLPVPMVQEQLQRALSTPGLGYTRELQEQLQEHAKLTLHYQEAFQAYSAAYTEMSKASIDRVQERLKKRTEQAKEPLSSTKELYDLWVDCSEEVYAEVVMSDEFVRLHGQLTNALMALKKHEREMTDEYMELFNMPSRREMDTLHERFQQSRRNEKAMHAQVQTLQDTAQALQDELWSLKQKLESRPKRKSRTVKKKKSR